MEHKEKVKEAMFAVGAGRIGNYDACSFEWTGEGQFRALEGSNPFIGQLNKVEVVKEIKVEMVVEDHLISNAIMAMKASHPYETPAYGVIKLESL